MTTPQPTTIEQWLAIATQRLPKAAATTIRNEIGMHFEDASEDFQSEGQSPADAQRRALADLGSAELTGRRLRDVHVGTRRYGIASAASLLTVIVLLGYPILIERLGLWSIAGITSILYATYIVLLCIPAIASLHVLRNLLEWRFGIEGAALPFWLIVGGLLTYEVFDVFTQVVYGYAVGTWTGQSMFTAATTVETLIAVIVFAGQVCVALGVFLLGARLWALRQVLYGLSLPLIASLVLLGITITGMAVAVVIDAAPIELIFSTLNQFAHMLLWPILTLLFYRAVYRPYEALPIRFA